MNRLLPLESKASAKRDRLSHHAVTPCTGGGKEAIVAASDVCPVTTRGVLHIDEA